jgi:hypothetical protein
MKLASIKKESGATMLEAVLVIPLVLILLLITFDLLRVCFYQLSLHYSLITAMRVVQIDPLQRTQSRIWNQINTELSGLGLTLDPANDVLTVCPITTFQTATCPLGTVIAPSPNELVVFSISKPVDLLSMSALNSIVKQRVQITATALARIENL